MEIGNTTTISTQIVHRLKADLIYCVLNSNRKIPHTPNKKKPTNQKTKPGTIISRFIIGTESTVDYFVEAEERTKIRNVQIRTGFLNGTMQICTAV